MGSEFIVYRVLNVSAETIDGKRQCVAYNAEGERCGHLVGPSQIVCGVHMVKCSIDDYRAEAMRRGYHYLVCQLQRIAGGDKPAKGIAQATIERIERKAQFKYEQRVRQLKVAGWSEEEIEMIRHKHTAQGWPLSKEHEWHKAK